VIKQTINMRKILLSLLFAVITVTAFSQATPTGSKTRWVNGVYLGTKLDAAFGVVDSIALYARADSSLMFKYKGTARALAYASLFSADSLQVVTARGNRANDSIRATRYIVEVGGIRFSSFHSDYQTNTFAGLNAGLNNTPLSTTQGRQNSFYGTNAGYRNTTGYAIDNFGYNAGYNNTTGGRKVNIGYQSGYLCDTCQYVTNIGTDAGYNNMANDQIFIGFHVAKPVDTTKRVSGNRHINIGNENATRLEGGYDDVVVGHTAANLLRNGYSNAVVGNYAATTGRDFYQSAIFGHEAADSIQDDYLLSHFGYRNGFSARGTYLNSSFGAYGLYLNKTGAGHSTLGYQSGASVTGGFYSTYIGFNSGYNALQKVDANFSIAIGESSYTTKSNQAVLGSTNITETLLRGKVLVNTETNNGVDALQINGSISATNLLSGTYTPTATVSTNVTSVTTYPLRYTRVGNVVSVSGMVEPIVTTANTQSKYFLSLPISPTANFSQIYYATVTGSIGSSTASTIPIYGVGESGGIRVEINFTATSTGSSNQVINISYTIVN
jgi:hypothetical protein